MREMRGATAGPTIFHTKSVKVSRFGRPRSALPALYFPFKLENLATKMVGIEGPVAVVPIRISNAAR
jgi:hypothetical protein